MKSIPFDNEEVQNILQGESENEGFQNSAVDLVFQDRSLPSKIDKDSFINILKNTPYSQRTGQARGKPAVILVNPESGNNKVIFTIPPSIGIAPTSTITHYGRQGDWNIYDYGNIFSAQDWSTIIQYYKDTNQKFTDGLIRALLIKVRDYDTSKIIVQSSPPMEENTILRPVIVGDQVLLVNTREPRASFIVSERSGKLLDKVISPAQARQILGGDVTPETPVAPTTRRGRPTGGQAQAAPVAGGQAEAITTAISNAGLLPGFQTLPPNIRTRILAGNSVPYVRRNAAIDAIGTVLLLISSGMSKFYIIRRPSGRVIGFATMQPDARHYVVTSTRAYNVPRVNQLANVLQTNGLNEATKTLIKFHAAAIPKEVKEIKELLKSLKK